MTTEITGRWWRGIRALAAVAAGALPVLAGAQHLPVTLLGADGLPVSGTTPYDTQRTCGTCHDLALMAQGYHFQQGRTNGAGFLNVSDTFLGALTSYDASGNLTKGTGAWWKLSDGMYGKW